VTSWPAASFVGELDGPEPVPADVNDGDRPVRQRAEDGGGPAEVSSQQSAVSDFVLPLSGSFS